MLRKSEKYVFDAPTWIYVESRNWKRSLIIIAKKDVHSEYVERDKVDFERTEELLLSGARKCNGEKRALHKTLTRKGKRESKADN